MDCRKSRINECTKPDRPTHAHRQKSALQHDFSRLLRNRCELCEQTSEMEVHHVGKLADLARPGPTKPAWDQLMAKRRRKTIVVCTACHNHIHPGQSTATLTA
jgi:hypothetical protein